jgi:hypothetical protein
LAVEQAAPGAAKAVQVRAVAGGTAGGHQESWQRTSSPVLGRQSTPTVGEGMQVFPAPQ